jgi:hypothetical protein
MFNSRTCKIYWHKQKNKKTLCDRVIVFFYFFHSNCFQSFYFQRISRIIYFRDNLDTDILGANIYSQILENNIHKKIRKTMKGVLPNINASNLKVDNTINDQNENNSQIDICQHNPVPEIHQNSNSNSYYSFLMNNNTFESEAESIKSILVRTGVFQGNELNIENDTDGLTYSHKDMVFDKSLRKPHHIVNNVYDAVKLIFENENYKI